MSTQAPWRGLTAHAARSWPSDKPEVLVRTERLTFGYQTQVVHHLVVNGDLVFASTNLATVLRELRKVLVRHRIQVQEP